MKIHEKRELRNIATNHYVDIPYKGLINICRKCTREQYSFLIVDTTLPANNSIKIRKNLLDSL